MKYLKLYEQFRLLLEADEKKDNTILYNLSQGGEKTLILLPGSGKDGGQGKDDFQSLADTLVKDFSVYSADFKNAFDVREYAKNIANEINNNDDIKQCAVGGFSIGGAIAWHLANALKGSKKFNNQLFFIDSGIPNSTEEFAEGIVKGNTPRIATAQPLNIFIKNRNGGSDITPEEQKQILNFYSAAELMAFKKRDDVKDNYMEYMDSVFPPSTEQIEKDSKGNNPWIIEDKYDKTNFKVRYSVKPKEVNGKSFKKGDVINNRKFVEQDTLMKKGLGRETTPGGDILPKLNGVEVISLFAGNKEGKPKSKDEIESSRKEAAGSTSGKSNLIVISGTEHGDITKSPALATNISSSFK
jgi:pimeloyl-ACP methyl ester carboxylesterase